MPKSKRDKKVSLTQTKKKNLDSKKKLVTEIKECIEKYEWIYIISLHASRNSKLKDVRHAWNHSRFFFGKNKVMVLGLGKSASDETHPNLHKLGKKLRGQTGLLFTNKSEKEVINWFNNYTCAEYARSGNTCEYGITIGSGLIPSFSHSLEPQLRQLGLSTTLEKGIIKILKPYTVCNRGSVLTPEQARILKLFGHKMAQFKIKLEMVWQKSTHKVKALTSSSKDDSSQPNSKDLIINPEDLVVDENEDTDEMMQDDADDDDDEMLSGEEK